jgi:hypothetical protein
MRDVASRAVSGFVCPCRFGGLLRVSPLAVAISLAILPRADAATLLSSPVMTSSFGPAAQSPGFSDTGGGRVGGALQPLGTASISVTQPASNAATVTQASATRNTETETPRPRVSGGGGGETRGGGRSRPRVRAEGAEETPAPRFRTPEVPRRKKTEEEPAPVPAQPEAKTEVVATTAHSPWSAELGTAWYSAYQSFRGVNILDSVSSEKGTGGVYTTSLKLGYARPNDAFTAGFNYWQGMSRVTPKGAESQVPPNSLKKDQENFDLPSRDRYSEYNFNLAYTRNFFDGKVVGTVGYNHFHFSNGNFYKSGEDGEKISYANELMLGVAYTALPYVQPSFSWAHDFDGFKGDYLELRVDGAFDLYSRGDFGIRLRPYAALSYDLKYNGTDDGFNAVELGLNIPVRLNNVFTLTFSGNYVFPLDESQGQPRASEGFWGGVKLTAEWGGPSPKAELPGYGKEIKMVAAEPGDLPWEVSVGAGWRQVNYDFDHRALAAFPTQNLYTPRPDQGDLGFASPGQLKLYANGFVDARNPAFNPAAAAAVPGTGKFGVSDPSQVFGNPGKNAQVRFNSDDFGYRDNGKSFAPNYSDQDSLVSPYLNIDRELFRRGAWSGRAGLLYAFTGSIGDSGYRLARLDSVFEQKDTYGFIYPLDNAAQLTGSKKLVPNVIVDRATYFQSLRALGGVVKGIPLPQTELTRTTREVERVGTFVRSNLDVTSHDLAVPLSARYDFGNRIHAEVTVSPGLTLASADLNTAVESREFENLSASNTTVGNQAVGRPNSRFFGPIFGGGFNGGAGAGVPPAAPPPPPVVAEAPTLAAAPSGGKAVVPKSPEAPGRVVGRNHFDDSATEVLFGVSGGASIILDLNEERTFYFELWGRYHWVQDFALDNGLAAANVDLTSFQGGFGLGYRF